MLGLAAASPRPAAGLIHGLDGQMFSRIAQER